MPRLSSHHFDAAKRLLTQKGTGTPADPAAAAARVYETLFGAVAPIIGAEGFRTLVGRSVRLSVAEFPFLAEALASGEPAEDQVKRIVVCLSKLEVVTAWEVATGLYATLLGLMTTFLGEPMVSQIVRSAFPETDLTAPEEGKE